MTDILATLKEAQRDARVAYCLGRLVPSESMFAGARHLKTPNDLYEFMLLDNQVADNVITSHVAQAIASLQQYISGIMMHIEPGYDDANIEGVEELEAWQTIDSRYPLWAAFEKIASMPENYIDPTLRLGKTKLFEQLETTLNQGRITREAVGGAVLSYLNEFEIVANLEVTSGYESDIKREEDQYYLIGRTRAKPYQYYWRVLDMGKKGGDDKIPPTAWNDWRKIDVPMEEGHVIDTLRPIYFNNRLYVFWMTSEKREETLFEWELENYVYKYILKTYTIKFYTAPKLLNDGWSSPQLLEAIEKPTAFIRSQEKSDSVSPAFKESIQEEDDYLFDGLAVAMHIDDNGEEKISVAAYQKGKDDLTNAIGYAFDAFLTNLGSLSPEELASLVAAFAVEDEGDDYRTVVGHPYKTIFNFAVKEGERTPVSPGPEIIPLPTTISVSKESASGRDYLALSASGFKAAVYSISTFSSVEGESIDCNIKGNIYCAVSLSGLDAVLVNQVENDIIPTLSSAEVAAKVYNKSGLELEEFCRKIQDLSVNIKIGDFDKENKNGLIVNFSKGVIVEDKYVSYSFSNITFDAVEKSKIEVAVERSSTKISTEIAEGDFSDSQQASHVQVNICVYDNDNKELLKEFSTSWPTNNDGISIQNAFIADISKSERIKNYEIKPEFKDDKINYNFVLQSQSFVVEMIKEGGEIENVYLSKNKINGAQFLDFSEVQIPGNGEDDEGKTFLPTSIRLNTLFGKELIKRASKSINDLLQWETQNIPEPPIQEGDGPPMDFQGANSLYFWELFFHMPFLVAWRLNLEQRYQEAADWLHYIFNPYRKFDNGKTGQLCYWGVRPLVENEGGNLANRLLGPRDPDQIAVSDPVHYRKAVYMGYVRNMIDRGDAAYRELTPDGLTSAKLWYVAALDLMGERPDTAYTSEWEPKRLQDLASNGSTTLRLLEEKYASQLYFLPVVHDVTMRSADTEGFKEPLNTELLEIWTTLESRLYNLRHSLTLDGKPLSLPLFAPPANPRELLAQLSRGGGGLGSLTLAAVAIPPYRFPLMLGKAQQAVDMLTQYGNTLLNLLERKDARDTEQLQLTQQLELLGFTLDLQQQAITMAQASLEGLTISQQAAQQRRDHYRALYDENISSTESAAMDLRTAAGVATTVAQPLLIAAGVASLAPNIFGFAGGGMQYGAPLNAAGAVAQMVGSVLEISAQRLDASEMYRRRRQDWEIQYKQADEEITQIAHQMEVQKLQLQSNRTQLQQIQAQQKQTKAMAEFLSTRFTSAALYQWLIGQLSALYFQAYDAVVSLCVAAEAAWQYEMGEFTNRFIQPGAWNDMYKGLLAGETLKLALQRMDQAYMMRNERRLEVVKTISLKTLLNEEWEKQRKKGKLDFKLEEKLFDEDYPGHYLRQLVAVTVSLPTVIGPYQDVRATLTQVNNALLTQPDIQGVKYLLGNSQDAGDHIKLNLRASQQVVLSSGIDDSGLFVLNFSDERYLPFEGTGAVSSWQLNFPNADSDSQKALLDHLTDVIIRIHYTAQDGGSGFAQAVSGELQSNAAS